MLVAWVLRPPSLRDAVVKWAVVAVGKIRDKSLRAVADEYRGRLEHYGSLREVEIDDGSDETLAPLFARHSKDHVIVALDSRGREFDSRGFAAFVERLNGTGKGNSSFLLGGKAGLGPLSLGLATHTISLSKLTLPHRLARVFLYEQLYRAMTLIRGEPYGL